jgi:hypothetical protein
VASAKDAAAAAAAAAGGGDDATGAHDMVLCLLQKSSVMCIYPTGEVLEAPLLQPCQMLWPLPQGVLLVVGLTTLAMRQFLQLITAQL